MIHEDLKRNALRFLLLAALFTPSPASTADPLMPIDGLKYYLVHKESGKFVHPYGGSDNPPDNTKLVWHDRNDHLALQFVFENGQIKHFGSGKYIHPLNGTARDDVNLVLYPGYRENTGVQLVPRGDRTYLQHSKSRLYVHPRGGSASPANDTELVYHHDFRPGIAITILPAEDVEVVKTVFNTSALASSPADTITAETRVTNSSSADQALEATVRYDRSITNTFSLEFYEEAAFSISRTAEVSAELPFDVGASLSLSMTFEMAFGSSQATTTSSTTSVQNSVTVKPTVKAGKTLRVIVTTQRKHGDVPFVMTLRSSSGDEFEKTGIMRTEYFFDQQVDYEEL